MSSRYRRINRTFLSLPCRALSVAVAILLLVGAAPAGGQNPTQETPTVQSAQPAAPGKPTTKDAHDAKIAADAEKLYQMALDLKVEVDKSNKDTVSLTVAKRAAELEKMAKTLKQEMRAN